MPESSKSLQTKIRSVLAALYPDLELAVDERIIDETVRYESGFERTPHSTAARDSAAMNLSDWLAVLAFSVQVISLALQAYDLFRRAGLPHSISTDLACKVAAESPAARGLGPDAQSVIKRAAEGMIE
jgi:dsRNA-specific ribonuclease